MRKISADELIEALYNQKPVQYWEIGEEIIDSIRMAKDETGIYLACSNGTNCESLLGYKIKIVSGDGYRFVTEGVTK